MDEDGSGSQGSGGGGSEDEEAESEEEYSDDDDMSWKVRRGAVKLLAAIIDAYPDQVGVCRGGGGGGGGMGCQVDMCKQQQRL